MSRVATLLVVISFFAGVVTTLSVQSTRPQPAWTEVTIAELLAKPDKYLGKTVAVKGYTYLYTREMKTLGNEPVQTDFYLLSPDKPRTSYGVIVAVFQEFGRPHLNSEKKSEIWAKWTEIEVTGSKQYGLVYLAHAP